ncbi:MAG TPA: DUF5050 domain-containing protein [Mobilitalea sp.]|nr:DUF5050 domain-containing protein [Mobilitalea sp.]
MLASIKRILITLVILTGVVIIVIFFYSEGRTYFSDEEATGNTAGNIYNGGLFCEKDGKIYFSNDNDDGSLYVMSSDTSYIKKLHDDKVAYINADENYVYYLRANNTRANNSGSILMFNNTGIYRINQNGKDLESISPNPGSYLTLKDNFLYYQNYDVNEGLYFYRNRIDNDRERLLIKEAIIPITVADNKLYYTGFEQDHDIHSMDLSSFTTTTVKKGSFAYPIFVGGYIYYLDISDNYSLNRMNNDGSDSVVLVNKRCSSYNITNTSTFLYYQIDDQENSRICRLSLDTMAEETLMEGNFKQLHVTSNYVFFKDFDNTHIYMLDADGSSKLSTFDPPNLNKDNKKK